MNKKQILAGFLIGLGGFAFLYTNEYKVLSPLLFSIGLIAVILLNCWLYTGKVGFVRSVLDFGKSLMICLWNFIGAAIIGLLTTGIIHETATKVIINKLSHSYLETFIRAILCGVMIYLAVRLYKESKNIITIIFPVYIFVICGMEHCIANMYYIVAARMFNLNILIFLLICIIGNAIGSLLVALGENLILPRKSDKK